MLSRLFLSAAPIRAAFSFAFLLICGVNAAHARAGDSPSTAAAAPTTPATAKSWVSIGEKPAILYDTPSAKGVKTFIVQRGTPLEVLVKLGQWTKVRDAEGSLGWIENNAIGDRRTVIVSSNFAEVRASALATAPLVFEAQRGVLLEVTGASADGWLPVRHRDGQSGFVKAVQVWGD